MSAPAAAAADAVSPDLISKRDLRSLDKGRMPVWASMSRLRLLGFVAALPVIIALALSFYAPEILRDYRYADTFSVATDLRATDGKCSRYVFLVTMCSASIRPALGDGPVHTSRFLMLFRSGGGVRMVPMRSTADASVVGISYAVKDMLLTRALSLAGVTALLGWVWWMLLAGVRKGRYKGGAAHAAALQYMALRTQPA